MEKREIRLLYIIIGIILLFLLFRFMIVFRVLLFVLLAAAVLGGGIYWLLRLWRKNTFDENVTSAIEERISDTLSIFREELTDNKQAIRDIKINIAELEAEQNKYEDQMATQNWRDLQELLDGFNKELQLRKARNPFYEQSINRLQQLESNHRLSKNLKDKRALLQNYNQSNNRNDISIDKIRDELDKEVLYLDSIDELSQRIKKAKAVEEAEKIKQRHQEVLEKTS